MKRNSLNFYVLLLIGCCTTSLFYSCSKDEVIQSNTLETDIVKFQTIEEYQEALNTVLSMSRDERKNYEESRGYKSFGRLCDEFYDEIDWDKFESIEEIKAFAASNDLIELKEDDDGEIIFDKTLSAILDRYFINSDRIFQIGDFVYKVFEEGIVSTHIENMHELIQNKSFSINSISKDEKFFVSYDLRSSSSILKTWPPYGGCGTRHYYAKSSGDYRAGIELRVNRRQLSWGSNWYATPYTSLEVTAEIRSFRKMTFGWAYSRRTINWRAAVLVDYNVSGWKRKSYSKSEELDVDGQYTYFFMDEVIDPQRHLIFEHGFGAYQCYVSMVGQPGVVADGFCGSIMYPIPISSILDITNN